MADDTTFTKADLDKAVADATAKFQASVDKLEAKNEELVGELRTTKLELRKSKEIDPAEVSALEDELAKAKAENAKLAKDVKDLTTRAETAEKAVEAESGFTSKLLTENALNTALAEAGVTNPAMLKAVKAMFSGQAAVAAEGDQRVVKIGDKALTDAIKEWAGTEEAKHFISAPGNRGGGAPGSGGGGGGGKTMSRSEFDGLDQGSRAAFFKEGGKVVDAAA